MIKKQKQKITNKKTHTNTKHTHTKYTKNQRKTTKKIPLKYFHVTACVINNKISNIVYISFVRYICSINSKVYKKRPNDDFYLMDTLMIRSSMMI